MQDSPIAVLGASFPPEVMDMEQLKKALKEALKKGKDILIRIGHAMLAPKEVPKVGEKCKPGIRGFVVKGGYTMISTLLTWECVSWL